MTENSGIVGVVLNPNAGFFKTKKGRKEFYRLAGRWNGQGGYLHEKYGDRIVIGAREKPEDIQYVVDEFIEREVMLVISVGGDGTQGNIQTNFSRRMLERTLTDILKEPADGRMITFLKQLNTKKGKRLPYFYNVKRGTVHAFGDVMGSTDNLEFALDNTILALDKGY